jgi:hypothetical protein
VEFAKPMGLRPLNPPYETSFVIPAKAGMTGIHKRCSPENSDDGFIILSPQGFSRDCLQFYATLGFVLGYSFTVHYYPLSVLLGIRLRYLSAVSLKSWKLAFKTTG